jgi:hypothetical protein
MVASAIAPCQCVATSDRTGVRIDSSGCRLAPIMRSFHQIVVQAEEMARQEEQPKDEPVSKLPAPSKARNRSMAERWARVNGAFRNAFRVVEEEDIPRAPPQCYACHLPFRPGEIRMYHGECDRARFDETIDLRKFKDFVRARYQDRHPVKEFALALDDKLAEVELPLVVRLVLRLSKVD